MSQIESMYLELLQQAVDKDLLNPSDTKFAESLLYFHENRGYLSPKQAAWVTKLIEKAQGIPIHPANPTSISKNEVVDASKLHTLFITAIRNKVVAPSIIFPDESEIRFTVFYSEDDRDIVFLDNARKVVARLKGSDPENMDLHLRNITPDSLAYKAIRRIIADPVEIAAVAGRKFNHCMFCSLQLSNEFSVTHGYGPICAANFGLPWIAGKGSKKAKLEDFIGLDSENTIGDNHS